MQNIYMVQASNTYMVNSFKAAYLPYAAGLLVAYAFADEKIKQNYEFKRFIFTRENTDKATEKMEKPFLVGFSNYIWNTQYNIELAKKIKKKFPEAVIVFGGHNVPPDNSFLEKYPFIDFLIHGEGEEAFKELLIELCKQKKDFSKLPNLSYRINKKENKKNPTKIIEKTDFPSPYLEGFFDYMFEENPNMQFDAILETSRGCPRNCAYCDWGCTNQKTKLFPIERVFAEIDWFAEHKVKFIWGADANFGAFDRDMDIVDYIIDTRRKTGYPERIRTNYAKNRHDRVFEINRKFAEYGLCREGATLSFQSLNPETLENIGRKNMSLDKFSELIYMYKKYGVPTYSELILGLPGETYESFCQGIGKLLASGQHRLITVYNCEMLPNAPMAEAEFIEKHGIKTATIEYLAAHTSQEDNLVKEKTKYIISTNTLSTEDWIACNIFSCFHESLHHHGILKFISIFLYKEFNIPYEDFYNKIIRFAKASKGTISNKIYKKLYSFFKAITLEEPIELYTNEIYGRLTWNPKNIAHMDTIYRIDDFYAELLHIFLDYGIEQYLLNEILKYEKTVLKFPGITDNSCDFEYNWHEYFSAILEDSYVPLKKKANRVLVHNEKSINNWNEYAVQAIWLGKNGMTFNQDITCYDLNTARSDI